MKQPEEDFISISLADSPRFYTHNPGIYFSISSSYLQGQLASRIPRGVLPIFVYGGVRMEGKIQTQKHGFPENFSPKNIGILHISYPKI